MRNTRLIIIVCGLISFLRGGVEASAQQFSAGLFGGLSTSQVDGDTYAGYDKAGLFTGAFVTKSISSSGKWSASFEITYIQKGSRKYARPDKGDYTSYKLNLNYAEVPILLRYAFSVPDSAGSGRAAFIVEGGVAAGALVQSEEHDSFGPVTGGTPFEKMDYSVLLGLHYYLTQHLGFNIRTEYSLLPVRKGGTSPYYQNWTHNFLRPGYYNNLIVFSIRYRL